MSPRVGGAGPAGSSRASLGGPRERAGTPALPREKREIGRQSVSDDEMAAISSAIAAYQREQAAETDPRRLLGRWAVAGRLEAHGLDPTRDAIARVLNT